MTVSNGADGDRDERGRFVVGNAGGPGNPRLARLADLQEAVRSAVTAEEIRAVLRVLLARAKKGDVQAAKLLLDRVCGPAPTRVEAVHAHAHVDAPPQPAPEGADLQRWVEQLVELVASDARGNDT